MEIIAWKNFVDARHYYVMQFNTGSMKEASLFKDLGWKEQGTGFNTKNNTQTIILKKEFLDTNAWLDWVKEMPFPIAELDKDGIPIKLKTKVTEKTGKRACSKCGKFGHNKATCKSSELIETVNLAEAKVARKNICQVCGGLGHNARRHKNDKH